MFYNSIISQFILFYTFYIFVDFIPTWLISWFSTFKLCMYSNFVDLEVHT